MDALSVSPVVGTSSVSLVVGEAGLGLAVRVYVCRMASADRRVFKSISLIIYDKTHDIHYAKTSSMASCRSPGNWP